MPAHDEAQSILQGEYDFLLNRDEELLQELYVKIRSNQLRPRTVVEYLREPFLHPAGNVRIALDRDIRTGMRSVDFFATDPLPVPVDEAFAVLEVKFDQFIPDFILQLVQLGSRRSAAFSKYAHSRKYD